MAHEFVLLVDGVLKTYTRYEDIPNKFDNVIKFRPDFSEGPHSDEEHEMLHYWNEKLQKLMEKERASNH
jgi:hypothetical protein